MRAEPAIAPLFRRLPHGPSRLSREEVARNQRARIFAAMIESVSRHGYPDTTVAHVLALAGVSRRSFYEQFSSKEDCCLVTYDIVVAGARRRMIDAWEAERGWSNRLHAGCAALLDRHRRGARGASARARRLARDRFASARADAARRVRLRAADRAHPRPRARGWRSAAAGRASDRRRRAPARAQEVARGPRARAETGSPARFSTGSSRTARRSPCDSADARRWSTRGCRRCRPTCSPRRRARAGARLCRPPDARAGLCEPERRADRKFAGISTAAFRRRFHGKEHCLMAVLDGFIAGALQAVRMSFAGSLSWPQAVHKAIDAFVGYLLTHRPLLRLAFVEPFQGGPAMIGRMMRSMEALAELLTADGPPPAAGARGGVRSRHGRALGDRHGVRRRQARLAPVRARRPAHVRRARALPRGEGGGRGDPASGRLRRAGDVRFAERVRRGHRSDPGGHSGIVASNDRVIARAPAARGPQGSRPYRAGQHAGELRRGACATAST